MGLIEHFDDPTDLIKLHLDLCNPVAILLSLYQISFSFIEYGTIFLIKKSKLLIIIRSWTKLV